MYINAGDIFQGCDVQCKFSSTAILGFIRGVQKKTPRFPSFVANEKREGV